MDDVGLILSGHHLVYGWRHGFGRYWMPRRLMNLIVYLFNHATCFLIGHDIFGPADVEGEHFPKTCTACCKEWPEDG